MERRLIDVTELLDNLNSLNSTDYGSMGDYKAHRAAKEVLNDVYRVVTAAPTIDAVEVVRCRECKYWKKYADHSPFIGTCKIAGYFVGEKGYCVYGARREPDENTP